MKTKFEMVWFALIAAGLSIFALVFSMNSIEEPYNFVNTEEEPIYTDFVDLDGDGETEALKLFITRDVIEGTETKLMIDSQSVIAWGQSPLERLFISDIDNTDNFKEVAITDNGPSSDYTTSFYAFVDGKIVELGTIPGAFDDMNMGEDGLTNIVNTQARGNIIHTWFYSVNYAINDERRLERIPQDFYEMNTEVTVLTSLDLVTSPEDDTLKTTLETGDHVMLAGCDDITWCRVDNVDGNESYGWFAVEDFSQIIGTDLSAGEVFDGLSYAD